MNPVTPRTGHEAHGLRRRGNEREELEDDEMTREFLTEFNENRMNLLGGLALLCKRACKPAWIATLQRLHAPASGELQKSVSTDTAQSLAKQLDLSACDYDIEVPEIRIGETGQSKRMMRLKAYHAGVGVSIELSDNGAGVNLESIKRKAIELGLIQADQPAGLGISTRTADTYLPKSNVESVEKIGSRVEMLTNPGEETTVKLHVPLVPKPRHQRVIWRPPAAAATTHLH